MFLNYFKTRISESADLQTTFMTGSGCSMFNQQLFKATEFEKLFNLLRKETALNGLQQPPAPYTRLKSQEEYQRIKQKKTNLATDQRTNAKQVRQAFTLLHNNSTVDSDNKFC